MFRDRRANLIRLPLIEPLEARRLLSATTPQNDHITESGVFAAYDYTAPSGVQYDAIVNAVVQNEQIGGQHAEYPSASVLVSAFDTVHFEGGLNSSASTEQFSLDLSMSHAHLRATFDTVDQTTNEETEIVVDLEWTQSGPTVVEAGDGTSVRTSPATVTGSILVSQAGIPFGIDFGALPTTSDFGPTIYKVSSNTRLSFSQLDAMLSSDSASVLA